MSAEVAGAVGGVIVLGEAVRGAEGAPLATAGVLGYALLGPGVAQVAAVVAVAVALGSLPVARTSLPVPGRGRHARPRAGPGPRAAGPRWRTPVAAVLAAACCAPLHAGGAWGGLTGAPRAALYLAAAALAGLCDAALAAAAAAGSRRPFAARVRDQARGPAATAWAVGAAGGVVLALAVQDAGPWAVPVAAVPLLLTQFGLRGHAAVRATYRQTVTALARATEVAGYTPEGHARRVGDLAAAVGRELGLPARQLTLLEYAALMHDIGQLSLVDPVPGGATEPLDAERRQAVAALGGEVVRSTGGPAEVALIVERQAHPYREQPLAGRIVRAVNAYEDFAGEGAAPGARPAALERLRLGTARDYDPRVVDALARVLAHRSTRAWLDAGGDGKKMS